MQKLNLKKSKLIMEAFYVPMGGQLMLKFKNGKTYVFKGVDVCLAEKFSQSNKPSKFFKKVIKSTYFATKIKNV